jgi:hypothetical protein
MCGTIKIILGHKTKKDTQLKFYKTKALPCLMSSSETRALRRADGRRLEAAEMRVVRCAAGTRLRS